MSLKFLPSEAEPPGGGKSSAEEVFTISKETVEKVRRKRGYAEAAKKSGGVKRHKGGKNRSDPYPGKAPVKPELLEKHSRGDGVQTDRVRTKYGQKMAKRREEKMEAVQETAAR
jgi:hypothetical protein